jgi:hypothetical protein
MDRTNSASYPTKPIVRYKFALPAVFKKNYAYEINPPPIFDCIR